MRRITRALVLLIAPFVAAACGTSDTVSVTGKLLKGGAAYAAPEGQRVGITFYTMTEAGGPRGSEPYAAQWNPADGTFTVPGRDGRGIPPGKYRVSIVRKWKRDALPEPKNPKKPVDRDTDLLKNLYGPETSPIVREVQSSSEMVIDLDRPTG